MASFFNYFTKNGVFVKTENTTSYKSPLLKLRYVFRSSFFDLKISEIDHLEKILFLILLIEIYLVYSGN